MRYRNSFFQVSALLLLVVAVQIKSPAQAGAADGFAARMPATAVIALGIADTRAFWAKADALPVTAALERLINSPANANNLDFQEFQLQLQKLGVELGYPATLDELMGNVFNRASFYIMPGQVENPVGNVVIDLGIADKEKAAKLVSVMDNKNEEAQKIAEAGAVAGAEPGFVFDKAEVAGRNVSHFKRQDGKEGFYGIVGDRFLFTNTSGGFAAATDGDGPTLADNADYSRLAGILPLADADFAGWIDADTLLKSGGMGAILGQLPGISASNKMAFTSQIGQGTVLTKMASTADPAGISDKIEARSLKGLAYIVPQPVAATVTGTVDADLVYSQMMPMLNMMGGFSGSSPLDQIEQGLGISIQNDVVPALGTEMFFALNGMGPNPGNPLVPLVDMLFGFEVRDGAKMAMIMKKIEQKIETQMASMAPPQPAGQEAAGPKFQTTKVGDAEMRSLAFPFPGISPSYSLADGYLVVGLTAESVSQGLQRAAGSIPGVVQGQQYRQLQGMAGTDDLYSFSTLDLARVAAIIQPYLPLLAQNMPPLQSQILNQVVSDVLIHMGQVTALESQEQGLFAGYMTVEMR